MANRPLRNRKQSAGTLSSELPKKFNPIANIFVEFLFEYFNRRLTQKKLFISLRSSRGVSQIMTKTLSANILAFCGALALGGCASVADEPVAPAGAVRQIASGPEIGRCHMNGCSWFEITDFDMVRETEDAALLRLTMREGASMHPNGRYPARARGVRIDWGPPTEEYFAFCSRRRPALITRSDDGAWEALRIDPTTLSGATEFVTRVYAHVCHDEDLLAAGAAERLGYRTQNFDSPTFRLDVPEQIFYREN